MTTPLRRTVVADDVPEELAVTCYRRSWRTVAAALVVASRVGGALLLARIVLVGDLPAVLLVAWALALITAPAALAAFLARGFAAVATVADGAFVVARRDLRVEAPTSAIVAVVPWSLPLPTPGASLCLRSGRRFPYDLALARPRRLATFLAERAGTATETDFDAAAFVHADASAGTPRWWHWLVKFPLLGLAPTAVFFRAHQWITYGGTFGEYYTYGRQAYLIDFLEHWATVTVYLALWAGLWRVGAEILVWLATRSVPRWTAVVRRAVEIACRLLYYLGVPALIALRFLD